MLTRLSALVWWGRQGSIHASQVHASLQDLINFSATQEQGDSLPWRSKQENYNNIMIISRLHVFRLPTPSPANLINEFSAPHSHLMLSWVKKVINQHCWFTLPIGKVSSLFTLIFIFRATQIAEIGTLFPILYLFIYLFILFYFTFFQISSFRLIIID